MVRILAILFGIAFIFGGVAGYGVIPQFMENGLLLGYFEVDAIHNLVHIVTGVLAIMAATSFRLSKLFFIIFGARSTNLPSACSACKGRIHVLNC